MSEFIMGAALTGIPLIIAGATYLVRLEAKVDGNKVLTDEVLARVEARGEETLREVKELRRDVFNAIRER